MNKIGVLVHDLAPSPKNVELLRELRKLIEQDPQQSLTIFYQNVTPHLGTYPYSTLSYQELWCFDGVVITTSIENTLNALQVPGIHRIVFYSYNLEWLHNGVGAAGPTPHNKLREVYCNPLVDVVARSPAHQKIIANNFNRSSRLCENFSIKELINV